MAMQTSAVTTPHIALTKLEDQAATAALYVTKHERNKNSDRNRFTDGDKLLSTSMTIFKSLSNSSANSETKAVPYLLNMQTQRTSQVSPPQD
jgi:hypothetical protein